MLTPSEVESLRQEAQEASVYYQKAFRPSECQSRSVGEGAYQAPNSPRSAERSGLPPLSKPDKSPFGSEARSTAGSPGSARGRSEKNVGEKPDTEKPTPDVIISGE